MCNLPPSTSTRADSVNVQKNRSKKRVFSELEELMVKKKRKRHKGNICTRNIRSSPIVIILPIPHYAVVYLPKVSFNVYGVCPVRRKKYLHPDQFVVEFTVLDLELAFLLGHSRRHFPRFLEIHCCPLGMGGLLGSF